MTGHDYAEGVSADFFKGLLVAIFITFLMGAAAGYVVPWAWHRVKPIIHRMTA